MNEDQLSIAPLDVPAPDWDENYGKTFRFVLAPQQNTFDLNGNPISIPVGTLSLITPHNKDAWDTWEEASDEMKATFKTNWEDIWKGAGGYKQQQVLTTPPPPMSEEFL